MANLPASYESTIVILQTAARNAADYSMVEVCNFALGLGINESLIYLEDDGFIATRETAFDECLRILEQAEVDDLKEFNWRNHLFA